MVFFPFLGRSRLQCRRAPVPRTAAGSSAVTSVLLSAVVLLIPAFFADPVKAAVTMESGEHTMSLPPKNEHSAKQLPKSQKEGETDEAAPASPSLFGGSPGQDSTMTTPQRPSDADTSSPEPLPWGIVPEVHVPWFPPGQHAGPLPPPGIRPPRPGVTPLRPDGSSAPDGRTPPRSQLRPQGHLPPAATLP